MTDFIRIKQLLYSKKKLWAIIAAGIIFRIVPYLANCSLWVDEAAISSNIVNRSFAGLLQQLDMEQGAPPGFLFLEKFAILLFGNNEFALRLFPLIFGILAIFLFVKVSKMTLNPVVLIGAVFLFVIHRTAINFAVETKQYSLDIFFALFIILATLKSSTEKINMKNFLLFGAAGVVAQLFSHASVFVMAGCGTTMMVASLMKKDYKRFTFFLSVSTVWLVFFGVLYFLLFRNLSGNHSLQSYWKDAFMPFPPKSFTEIIWPFVKFYQLFKNPMGFTFAGVAVFLFISGGIYQYSRNRQFLLMLMLPIFFALIASVFHKYPFEDRVMIFTLPAFIILIVNGIYFAVLQVKKFKPLVTVVFLILIMGPMTLKAMIFVIKPQREEIKDVLTFMEKNIKNGDKIYVAYYAERAFSFYKEKYSLSGFEIIPGHSNKTDEKHIKEIKKLDNQGRVWFVFTYWEKNRNEDLVMTKYLKENYEILHEIYATEATGLLVDMTAPKSENLNE
jgi:hypothetical protein